MSGYSELKNAIRRVVKTNNNREITGQNLQNALTSMVNSLGANYHFAGFASPDTNPGTPDQNIFYIASEEGNYVNFNGIILESGLSFLMWNGEWSSETISVGEVTKSWVQQNYVSTAFFNELFELYNNNTKIPVNSNIPVDKSKLNIKAMFGFWTEQYLSALGYNSSGGSGGTGDVTWDLLASNSDTRQIAASHLNVLNNYATQSWIRQNYLSPTLSNIANGDILIYDSVGAWVNISKANYLSGYATQSWVNQQGYVTSSALNGYIHPTLTNLAEGNIIVYDGSNWVNTPWPLTGYATQSWVTSQGYITSAALPTRVSQLTNDAGYVTASIVDGYATQNWVQQNYVSVAFFERLFQAYNGTTKVNTNSTSTIDNIKAMFGFWTEQYLSALGYNSSGGSGGTGDVTWDLLANNSDTRQIALSHLTSALNGYATQSWVNSLGYIAPTLSGLANGDILVYDSVGAWVNVPISSFLSGYATQSWVNQQGFSKFNPTISSPQNRDIVVYESGGAGWLNASLDTLLSGYATQNWVGQQGYLTSSALAGYIHPTLTNLANGDILVYDSVGAWVNTNLNTTVAGFGYITSSALAGYLPLTGGTVTGATTFKTANYYDQLEVFRDTAGGNVAIKFSNSDGTINSRFIGLETSRTADKAFYFTDNSNTNKYFVATESMLANYLPLTGGTLTGRLYINQTNSGTNLSGTVIQDNSNVWASRTFTIYAPYLTSGNSTFFLIGKTTSSRNMGWIGYIHASDGSTDNRLDFGLYGVDNILHLLASGNVGIATASPAYKLDVYGSANATTLYENGSRVITTANIGSQSVNYATSAGGANHAKILGHEVYENTYHSLSNGDTLVYDSGTGWLNVPSGMSDIRKKDIINYNAEPTFEAVANAPAIRFTYKDARYSFNQGIHVGSIAQYWQTTLPETVTMDNDGMLSMKYDVIALLSTISVAKKVSEHERRIVILERENEALREELSKLKTA